MTTTEPTPAEQARKSRSELYGIYDELADKHLPVPDALRLHAALLAALSDAYEAGHAAGYSQHPSAR